MDIDEATTKLKGFRAQIVEQGADKLEGEFEKLAKVESDCSSAKRGGDLGSFGRGKMQKPFEDASFGLQVGELSEVVSTDSGVHIIYRIA
jgi:NIMA-interacting peptidyl-prolyl cis-trans isomerase 1